MSLHLNIVIYYFLTLTLYTVDNLTWLQEPPQAYEDYESFLKRTFTRRPNESEQEFVKRTFTKYDDETDSSYLERIDTLIASNNDRAFYNTDYKDITRRYFDMKYEKKGYENLDEYNRRILTRKQEETFDLYKARIKCIKNIKPQLTCWNSFAFDRNTYGGYRLQTRSSIPNNYQNNFMTLERNYNNMNFLVSI